MKKMELKQMENLIGGRDCSVEERLIRLGTAGATGAFGGPFGFLGGLAIGLAYDAYVCGWQ